MLCIQLGELLYKQLYVVSGAFTFDTSVAHGGIIAVHEKPRRQSLLMQKQLPSNKHRDANHAHDKVDYEGCGKNEGQKPFDSPSQ